MVSTALEKLCFIIYSFRICCCSRIGSRNSGVRTKKRYIYAVSLSMCTQNNMLRVSTVNLNFSSKEVLSLNRFLSTVGRYAYYLPNTLFSTAHSDITSISQPSKNKIDWLLIL